jgi:hypothetical protein
MQQIRRNGSASVSGLKQRIPIRLSKWHHIPQAMTLNFYCPQELKSHLPDVQAPPYKHSSEENPIRF